MMGDRFFDFTCVVCNGREEETVKKVDMSW